MRVMRASLDGSRVETLVQLKAIGAIHRTGVSELPSIPFAARMDGERTAHVGQDFSPVRFLFFGQGRRSSNSTERWAFFGRQ